MKRLITLMLTAGLVFGAATGASAIDFNAKGQWLFGFGASQANYMQKNKDNKQNSSDVFKATQRVRLQMDAVASEALSGTVFFEIGDQKWGDASKGGALGADGKMVEIKRAYIDWLVPQTALKFRMGLQGLTLPNVAGGSAIFDDDVAGISANYTFNDNVGLTFIWARPYNDNYDMTATSAEKSYQPTNFLDNVDLFTLAMPVTMDGWAVTPWVMYGMVGKNSLNAMQGLTSGGKDLQGSITAPLMYNSLLPFALTSGAGRNLHSRNAYGSAFFAGLPIAITAADPFNFELDLNYGSVTGLGRYDVTDRKSGVVKRGNSDTQGWLIKGLAEYKMEWMTPGIFAWYGSGDDGNVKNGSERMPSLAPCGNFTSMIGDDPVYGWATTGGVDYDQMLNYAGTWGIGLQFKDISFLQDLKHTFRVAYWGGTNSTSAVKYAASVQDAFSEVGNGGFYLTNNDYLLEFNLNTSYKIYDNLEMAVMLGYVVNGVDRSTWKHGYNNDNVSFQKGDAYKADVFFSYSF